MITRKDIAAHLERGVRTGFVLGAREYTPMRSTFAKESPSDGAFEVYADMGTPPWPRQNAGKTGPGTDSRTGLQVSGQLGGGGAIEILGGNEKGVMVYNVDWEIAIGVEHNAIDDDRAGDLEDWARSASVQFERHKDYLAFDALNSGAGTTYGNGYDGVAMIDASHADPGAEYTTVQDNEYALVLTMDNFETVKVAGSKFLDDRGQPVGLNHNLLIVPPDLERVAFNITGNPEVYDTADRERNPYSGRTAPLVAPGGWLDTTSWFLIDPNMPQKPINIQMRKDPQLVIWDVEADGGGGTRYFKFHARYNVFYGDWRLLVQGNT